MRPFSGWLRQPPVLNLGDVNIMQTSYEVPGTYTDIRIDFLFGESEFHAEALRRRIPQRLPSMDVDIAVVRCEDLILFKLLAGRVLDRLDAAGLLRANGDILDLAYLKQMDRALRAPEALAGSLRRSLSRSDAAVATYLRHASHFPNNPLTNGVSRVRL